jgi:hypothetical protein
MTDRLADDPIYRHLQEQDRYWQENPRDEAITRKPGWKERWETGEGPR